LNIYFFNLKETQPLNILKVYTTVYIKSFLSISNPKHLNYNILVIKLLDLKNCLSNLFLLYNRIIIRKTYYLLKYRNLILNVIYTYYLFTFPIIAFFYLKSQKHHLSFFIIQILLHGALYQRIGLKKNIYLTAACYKFEFLFIH